MGARILDMVEVINTSIPHGYVKSLWSPNAKYNKVCIIMHYVLTNKPLSQYRPPLEL